MKKIVYFFVGFIIIYVTLQLLPYNQVDNSIWVIEEGEKPLIIAHGGAKKLNPENTMIAFDYAYNLGVDVLEIDLMITKDNVLVCHHGSNDGGNISMMSDGSGFTYEYTFEELQEFNFGYNFKDINGEFPYKYTYNELKKMDVEYDKLKIPSLEHVFSTYNDTKYVLEIKHKGEFGRVAAKELKELLIRYNLEDKVIVTSFHQDTLEYFYRITNGKVTISADRSIGLTHVLSSYLGHSIFYKPIAHGVEFPLSEHFKGIDVPLATKYLIWKTHKHNMFVHYWTINDKETMKELILMGVDGIITDRPDLMKEVLEELGY